jgi:hypothetical protein
MDYALYAKLGSFFIMIGVAALAADTLSAQQRPA